MNSKPSAVCGDYDHKNSRGEPCGKWVMIGTQACKWHAGKQAAKHRADGALRKAVDDWGISRNEYVDPGDTLLRLIAQSSRRVQRYSDAIAALVEANQMRTDGAVDLPADEEEAAVYAATLRINGYDPELSVLLAPEYAVTKDGDRVLIGKQISALIKLESEERDRLANWCRVAIAAGLEERRVKMAEQQGTHLAAVVRGFAERLGLTAEQKALMPVALRGAVTEVFGRQPTASIEGQIVS